MTKLLPRFAVLAILGSLIAVNAHAAPGAILAWNDCSTDGAADKTFACTVNTGANIMFASYIPPAGITAFIGLNAVIDLTSSSGTIPSWWALGSVGGECRSGKFSSSSDFTTNLGHCTDFFAGGASGGGNYATVIDTSGGHNTEATAPLTNHARIKVIWGVPDANAGPLDENTEYYGFKATITNALSTGTGSCAGCLTSMCIVLNQVNLAQPAPAEDIPLTTTPGGIAPSIITWQGGSGADCNSVPVRNRTWGQIKSLYH